MQNMILVNDITNTISEEEPNFKTRVHSKLQKTSEEEKGEGVSNLK